MKIEKTVVKTNTKAVKQVGLFKRSGIHAGSTTSKGGAANRPNQMRS